MASRNPITGETDDSMGSAGSGTSINTGYAMLDMFTNFLRQQLSGQFNMTSLPTLHKLGNSEKPPTVGRYDKPANNQNQNQNSGQLPSSPQEYGQNILNKLDAIPVRMKDLAHPLLALINTGKDTVSGADDTSGSPTRVSSNDSLEEG